MCGIFAAYDPQKSLTPSQLLGASKLLIHRGPDNQGYYFDLFHLT